MDRTAANLAKLDTVLERAQPHFPVGPSIGTNREYEDLRRHWAELVEALRPIDGWCITASLPDIDAVGRAFLDYAEIGEPPFDVHKELEEPGHQLDEYRFRLRRARRSAVSDRIELLVQEINEALERIVPVLPGGSDFYDDVHAARVNDAFRELDRLIGDTAERKGRWYDMARHLSFAQPHDWRDIAEFDWPDVRERLQTILLSEFDPVAVADIDLGRAAASKPVGGVSTALAWHNITDDGFERVLFDLLRGLDGYENVQWLTKTRAPDRGRDLSLDRQIIDAAGPMRSERVIVQAKHWTSKSIRPTDVVEALASIPTWEPPRVTHLVIATTGRFTADAVAVIEKHNLEGKRPQIEMWPDSQLEAMSARRPDIVEAHDLRGSSLDATS